MNSPTNKVFHISQGILEGADVIGSLNDNTIRHIIETRPPFLPTSTDSEAFDSAKKLSRKRPRKNNFIAYAADIANPLLQTRKRYGAHIFQGILVDSGAAEWSTIGYSQFRAYERVKKTPLNKARAGEAVIGFGDSPAMKSLGTIDIESELGNITFHVTPTDTPALLSLADMDRYKVKLDNLENILIKRSGSLPYRTRRLHFQLSGNSAMLSFC